MPKIAIVGAGVLGAAIAWRLAEAGHDVTIYDPRPGGLASPGSFAWLNASFAEDPVYNRLRHDSLERWGALKEQAPDVPVTFPGAVLWEQDHFDLPEILESQRALGREASMLSAQDVTAREPALPNPPDRSLLLAQDGYGEPAKITQWFLDRATAAGAAKLDLDVTGLDLRDGRIAGIRTSAGENAADHVIVCAGVRLPELLKKLGLTLEMQNEPGMLATTSAAPKALNAMLATPEVHVWQGDDGRYLMGADFGGSQTAPDPEAEACQLISSLKELLPNATDVTLESTTMRERPKPVDGRPAIGAFGPQGLYVVSTHSGMTLAPLIGEMVAHEITTGEHDPRLAPYRPDRDSLRPKASVS